jgi:hypothetical protein
VKVWLLVYGVLYVVIEMVGHSLETVGWTRITALDVATAVTDAFLTVSLVLAALLAFTLAGERWGRSAASRLTSGGSIEWPRETPIGVRSWRPEPPALPSATAPATRSSASSSGSTYAIGAYSRRRRIAPSFPEDPGHLL